ncbi:MAG TPA: CRISPR-associated protein Cas4 [Firmicutes bacterium]|nr:CRISPR-associated protein Cas4 [Bacillota bacterium]
MNIGNHESPLIQISAIQHFAFCPRQCFLIHIEQIFEENVFTILGKFAHERVDSDEIEWRSGVRIEHALPLWSDRLGLIGKADSVEFHDDGTIYPVEGKLGKKRQKKPDDLQLCAQAMCLEEMFGTRIELGAVFSYKSKRRREVAFTNELRAETVLIVSEIREFFETRRIPAPPADKRCPDCSLIEVCQPEAMKSLNDGELARFIRKLFSIEENLS